MFKNLKFSKNFIYLFFIISAITFFLCDYKGEADIWFLLSHGRYVLENGFSYTDPLSMHTGLNFVMQQWLSSVIFYLIYEYLGKMVFYIFIFLMNCLITYLVYKLCLVVSNKKKFVSCFITVITMVLLQLSFIVPRPQIFTFIILLVILIMLELFSSKRKEYLYYMPLFSILLINLHASMWPMMFVFCMPYVAELLLKKDKDIFKIIIIMIISFFVGLINPYGIDAILYSLKCYGDKLICMVVGEMTSFDLLGGGYTSYWSFSILGIFLICNLIMLVYSKKNNFRVAHLLLFYGTFYMALSSIRNVSLFLIATIPFLVKYIKFKDDKKFILNRNWIINYIIIGIIFITSFSFALKEKYYEFDHASKELLTYLNENASKDIKLYTDYSDGSLFEYYGYKPYIDSRAEVFLKKMNNKEDILKEYIDFNLDIDSREKFIKKYDFDYYVISDDYYELVEYLINHKDYNFEIVYSNKHMFLIKRVK